MDVIRLPSGVLAPVLFCAFAIWDRIRAQLGSFLAEPEADPEDSVWDMGHAPVLVMKLLIAHPDSIYTLDF
jgi:hypothetical protein